MTFEQELARRVSEIEEVLKRYLPERTGPQRTVMEAMEYSLLAGGKRLRPVFMAECYRMFGGDCPEEIEPFLAAIEMIHTYSLVHDDLPCMDNDEYRRGRKTTHVVYGENMAVLAGDALLNYAFETACQVFGQCRDAGKAGRALGVLARKAGIYGMIGGQVVDVQSEGKAVDRETLDFIYRLKTGALLEASMMVGAIMAGAGQEEVEAVEEIAALTGMAFQIQDDILDRTSTTEVLGKPVHSDEKNEKCTYVVLEGLEKAREQVADCSGRALEVLKKLEEKTGRNVFLEELIQALVERIK